nr:hypothetical protein Iba_chr11dCG8320 [Ipomoea batatas]
MGGRWSRCHGFLSILDRCGTNDLASLCPANNYVLIFLRCPSGTRASLPTPLCRRLLCCVRRLRHHWIILDLFFVNDHVCSPRLASQTCWLFFRSQLTRHSDGLMVSSWVVRSLGIPFVFPWFCILSQRRKTRSSPNRGFLSISASLMVEKLHSELKWPAVRIPILSWKRKKLIWWPYDLAFAGSVGDATFGRAAFSADEASRIAPSAGRDWLYASPMVVESSSTSIADSAEPSVAFQDIFDFFDPRSGGSGSPACGWDDDVSFRFPELMLLNFPPGIKENTGIYKSSRGRDA